MSKKTIKKDVYYFEKITVRYITVYQAASKYHFGVDAVGLRKAFALLQMSY